MSSSSPAAAPTSRRCNSHCSDSARTPRYRRMPRDPQASHVILPGVGAAADAMSRLRRNNLDALIPSLQQPVLGICLGMQLLFEASEEGDAQCLGIIPGRATRFAPRPGIRFRTWAGTRSTRRARAHCLTACTRATTPTSCTATRYRPGAATIASSDYGVPFSACVQWRNFFGTQFHPERSSHAGARLAAKFPEPVAAHRHADSFPPSI